MAHNLLPSIARLAQLQKIAIDRLELQEAVVMAEHQKNANMQLNVVSKHWCRSGKISEIARQINDVGIALLSNRGLVRPKRA